MVMLWTPAEMPGHVPTMAFGVWSLSEVDELCLLLRMGMAQALPSILIVHVHTLPLPYTRKLSAYVSFINDAADVLTNLRVRLGNDVAWSLPLLSFFKVSLATDNCAGPPAGIMHLSAAPFTRL